MTYTLIPNIWYTITPETDCDIDTPNGISIHLPAGIQYFHFADSVSIDISGTATVTQNPPLFKPASASALGGGFIESNLRIGHGASAAVPAVCTLTLGDPTAEGTLMDNSTPVAAGASVTPLESYAAETEYSLGIGDAENTYGGFTWTPGEAGTPADFVDALNTLGNWGTGPQRPMETPLVHAELDEDTGKVVLTLVDENWLGTDGNLLKVKRFSDTLPISDEVPVSFSGGVDRRALHLEAPHKYATGTVSITDATAAGTLTIGEWSREWEAKADAKASGTFVTIAAEGEVITVTNGGAEYTVPVPDYDQAISADGWNAAFTAAGCGIVCTAVDAHGEIEVSVEAAEAGEAGNSIVISVDGYEPVTLAGGSTARTAVDVFNDILEDADCPVDVTLDADELGLGFTAKELGVNDTITITGSMFSDAVGMSGGHGDYTVAELVTAIEGEFEDITPAAGETEGTITLTATTAGKAANAIVYTSTGCFGGETVKQGSTTRGKDAVTQTDYEIVLNGGAPQPLDLTSTEPLKNGHVYTLAVAADTDLAALTVKQYATCELWLDYTAGSVTWPQGLGWAEGSAPTLAAGKSYAIALRNDGVKLRANVQYEDTTPTQS